MLRKQRSDKLVKLIIYYAMSLFAIAFMPLFKQAILQAWEQKKRIVSIFKIGNLCAVNVLKMFSKRGRK